MSPHVEMQSVKGNMPFEILEKVVDFCKNQPLIKNKSILVTGLTLP